MKANLLHFSAATRHAAAQAGGAIFALGGNFVARAFFRSAKFEAI